MSEQYIEQKFYLTPDRGWLVGTLKNHHGIISNIPIPDNCLRIDIVTIFPLESERFDRIDTLIKEEVNLSYIDRLIARFGSCPIAKKKRFSTAN